MLASVTLILVVLKNIHCEWIEIPQISHKPTERPRITNEYSTPVAFEDVLIRPFRNHNNKSEINKIRNTTITHGYVEPVYKNNKSEIMNNNNVSEIKMNKSEINKNVDNKDEIDVNVDANEHGIRGDNKMKSFDVILKMIQKVKEAFSKIKHKTFNDKLDYLNKLMKTLLCSIQVKINETWPDDKKTRAVRSTKGNSIDFPSAESALMTISFLTFAVFLIKLVMQVLNAYKNKGMMYSPVFTAAGKKAYNLHQDEL